MPQRSQDSGSFGHSKHRKACGKKGSQTSTRHAARLLNKWAEERERKRKKRERWYGSIRDLFNDK